MRERIEHTEHRPRARHDGHLVAPSTDAVVGERRHGRAAGTVTAPPAGSAAASPPGAAGADGAP